MRRVLARKAERSARVRQAVAALIRDRRAGGPLREALVVAAALDHEIRDDAVEYGAVIGAVPHVAQEILRGERGAHRVHFDDDVAEGRLQLDARQQRARRLREGRQRREKGEQEGNDTRHDFHLGAILAYLPREAARPIP